MPSVRGIEGKQRRTRRSGNTEGGKAIILEMGQHMSIGFKLSFQIRLYRLSTVFCVEDSCFILVGINLFTVKALLANIKPRLAICQYTHFIE